MADESAHGHAFEEIELFRKGEPPAADPMGSAPSPAPAAHHSVLHGTSELLSRIEDFLFMQSELLDTKAWQAYIDLFTEDGLYWMPVSAQQQEWLDTPSIMLEDKSLLTVRMNRMLHPGAWSMAGLWETSHIVGNVRIEAVHDGEIQVRSRFHMFEQRRNIARQFAGVYWHTLVESQGTLKIKLQRVDLVNAQAPYDYVIQAWV